MPGAPGACDACAESLLAEEGRSLEAFVEDLPQPVLIVSGDVVAQAANRRARAFVGKEPPEIVGRRGGDVIECAHAGLPGGCGHTVHCQGCALRRSVEHTHTTGEPLTDVIAYQNLVSRQGIRRLWFRLATQRAGEVVLVRIDEVGPERSE